MTGEPDDVDSMVEPVVPSRHHWLAGLLEARPGDRVVDLGCGTGATLAQVAPAVAGGLVAGLDLSAAALGRAAAAVEEAVAGQERPPAVLLVQADLKAPLPLAEASFDRVFCHNVLEVLPDHGALLAEAARLLRPGGRLVLAHSDFDTLVFASEDLELTRRLVRDHFDTQQSWMDAVDGTIGGVWPTSPAGPGSRSRTSRPRSSSAGGSGPGRSAGATPATWPTPCSAGAGPRRPSWTAGWPASSTSTTGGRSCSASTTTPSSVVESGGDVHRSSGATVRRLPVR